MKYDIQFTQEFWRTVEGIEANSAAEAVRIMEDKIASTRYNPSYFDEPHDSESIYVVYDENGHDEIFMGSEVYHQ